MEKIRAKEDKQKKHKEKQTNKETDKKRKERKAKRQSQKGDPTGWNNHVVVGGSIPSVPTRLVVKEERPRARRR
jgi:hypothetical protein